MVVKIDLHTHSDWSDGIYRPAEVIRIAKEQGLSVIALTDHDSVSGLEEALDAGKQYHIKVLPGIELNSCKYFPGMSHYKSVHILGYFNLELQNWNDNRLAAIIGTMSYEREKRNKKMVERLKEQGIPIEYEEVLSVAKGTVGKPHIGQVLSAKGYAPSVDDAIKGYLAPGKHAYVPKEQPIPAEESVKILSEIRAVPVLAHPAYIQKWNHKPDVDSINVKRLIRNLTSVGLEGMEVYVLNLSARQFNFFKKLAGRYHLIPTGGSDFHANPNRLGRCAVPEESLEELEMAIAVKAR